LWKNYKNNIEKVTEVERGAREIERATKNCKHFAFAI
jgi:hypothetical protein